MRAGEHGGRRKCGEVYREGRGLGADTPARGTGPRGGLSEMGPRGSLTRGSEGRLIRRVNEGKVKEWEKGRSDGKAKGKGSKGSLSMGEVR